MLAKAKQSAALEALAFVARTRRGETSRRGDEEGPRTRFPRKRQ